MNEKASVQLILSALGTLLKHLYKNDNRKSSQITETSFEPVVVHISHILTQMSNAFPSELTIIAQTYLHKKKMQVMYACYRS